MKVLLIIMLLIVPYSSFAQQGECNYKVEILVNSTEFEKDDFTWRMKATKIEGKSTNITGTARIESNGETIKSYKPWTSEPISKQKTSSVYSPNLKSGNYNIIAEIGVECNDVNKGNNIDAKTIKIKERIEEANSKTINQPPISKTEDSITIDNVENSIETSNDSINKETTKKSEPLSNNSSLQETKNMFTAQATKEAKDEEFNNVIKLTKMQDTQLTNAANVPQTVYVSSNEKSKELILIFLLAVSVLLNIVLIWRR